MAVGARRIMINTATGSGTRIIAIGIVFLTTPVLVTALGTEAFGLFTIIASLPAYAGLLDFGIGGGLVKHLTEYSEADDGDGVRHVMTMSLCFYMLLGLVLIPAAYLVAPFVVHLLGVPARFDAIALLSLPIMCLYFVLSGMAGVFSARLVALHRMDITAAIGLAAQVIYGVLVFALIPWNPTIPVAIGIVFVQLIVTGVLSYAAVLRLDSRLYCNPASIPGPLVRRLFAFGGWMQLNSLTSIVNMEADKFIIAVFLNINAVTSYQIGNRLASLNRIIPLQLLSAIMPAATILQAGRGQEETARFYRDVTRYLMLLTLVITGFVIACAGRLIVTWLGQPYPQATSILIALSLSFVVNNLTGGGTTLSRAAGKPQYETAYAVLSMVLNIGLTVLLAPIFGLAGILGGTIVANLVGSTYFMVLFHRRFGVPWMPTIGTWLWRLCAATILAAASVHGLQLLEAGTLPTDRLTGLLLLTVYGVVYLMVFGAGLTLLGFWSEADMGLFRRVLSRFRIVRSERA